MLVQNFARSNKSLAPPWTEGRINELAVEIGELKREGKCNRSIYGGENGILSHSIESSSAQVPDDSTSAKSVGEEANGGTVEFKELKDDVDRGGKTLWNLRGDQMERALKWVDRISRSNWRNRLVWKTREVVLRRRIMRKTSSKT